MFIYEYRECRFCHTFIQVNCNTQMSGEIIRSFMIRTAAIRLLIVRTATIGTFIARTFILRTAILRTEIILSWGGV